MLIAMHHADMIFSWQRKDLSDSASPRETITNAARLVIPTWLLSLFDEGVEEIVSWSRLAALVSAIYHGHTRKKAKPPSKRRPRSSPVLNRGK